jgi:hypothetical protein
VHRKQGQHDIISGDGNGRATPYRRHKYAQRTPSSALMAIRDLCLIVPGLLDTRPPLPAALGRLLARADPAPLVCGDGYEAMLCRLFGLGAEPGRDLPIAALTHLVDFDADHEGIWMRADPVHLRADLGRLRLFDSAGLDITREEALGLAAELASLLAEHGLSLQIGRDPTRWYLRLPRLPEIATRPPGAALGAHIDPYLPSGPERRSWHRLQNDVQMVLHGSPINAARQGRGEAPVNSLWFWGAGALPAPLPGLYAQIWADEPLPVGLARHGGVLHAPVPETAAGLLGSGAISGAGLAVLTPGTGLDERWFAPLLAMLKRRALRRLCLYTEMRGYTVTWAGAWRVWRRVKDTV